VTLLFFSFFVQIVKQCFSRSLRIKIFYLLFWGRFVISMGRGFKNKNINGPIWGWESPSALAKWAFLLKVASKRAPSP
jgi:hypothetical protein